MKSGIKTGMKTIAAALILLPAATGPALAAGDAEAGKGKTGTCVACHGAEGISPNPLWPNLAGQKDQYLIAQMQAFRDGERNNAMMSPMAAALSDQDIEDLAAFYSSLSCAP